MGAASNCSASELSTHIRGATQESRAGSSPRGTALSIQIEAYNMRYDRENKSLNLRKSRQTCKEKSSCTCRARAACEPQLCRHRQDSQISTPGEGFAWLFLRLMGSTVCSWRGPTQHRGLWASLAKHTRYLPILLSVAVKHGCFSRALRG